MNLHVKHYTNSYLHLYNSYDDRTGASREWILGWKLVLISTPCTPELAELQLLEWARSILHQNLPGSLPIQYVTKAGRSMGMSLETPAVSQCVSNWGIKLKDRHCVKTAVMSSGVSMLWKREEVFELLGASLSTMVSRVHVAVHQITRSLCWAQSHNHCCMTLLPSLINYGAKDSYCQSAVG